MTSLALSQFSRGMALSRTLGPQLLSRALPVSGGVVPRKTFILSPVVSRRIRRPETEEEKEDELHHWVRERYVAVALLPIIPTAIAYPHPALDMLLTTAVMLHSHWRLSGVAEDYIHGEILPTIMKYLVLTLSISAFGGLCYFNYNDIGLANAIRMLYTQL